MVNPGLVNLYSKPSKPSKPHGDLSRRKDSHINHLRCLPISSQYFIYPFYTSGRISILTFIVHKHRNTTYHLILLFLFDP